MTQAIEMQSARWFTPLPELGVIEVAGADAPKFLQGQATCDILALDDTTSSLGAFCTAKGRVLAVFRAFRRDDRIYLVLPRSLVADIAKRLSLYVLRSAVTLTDVSGDWTCTGLNNACGALDFVPATPVNTVSHHDSITAISIPYATGNRTLLLVPTAAAEPLLGLAEAAGFARVPPDCWHLQDIHAGLPTVLPGTVEAFIPQMMNLDSLGGIGFKKGCYTGQEVVARTHYLGTVKRRMYRLVATLDHLPEPGSAIFADGIEPPVGMVVASAKSANGQVEMLAVLNSEQAPIASLRLDRDGGDPLVLADLPGIE
jgi:folate-binding protein YgfZ